MSDDIKQKVRIQTTVDGVWWVDYMDVNGVPHEEIRKALRLRQAYESLRADVRERAHLIANGMLGGTVSAHLELIEALDAAMRGESDE